MATFEPGWYIKKVLVTNPQNDEMINCNSIVSNLADNFKQDINKFYDDVMLLNKCLIWDDTIYKQINELRRIIDNHGFCEAFKVQLDKVLLYANVKNKEYIPIIDTFTSMYEQKKDEHGISFLCNELDRLTDGIISGSVCTICGAPGSMKTTYAVNVAYNAVKKGKNICYLSLEETPFMLMCKLLSRVSVELGYSFPVGDITKGTLEDKDKNILYNEILPYLKGLEGSFHIIGESDLVSYEFKELERYLEIVDNKMKERNNDNHGIDVIVVDHIQLLKYASSEKDEFKIINQYVSFFRKQALSFLNTGKEIAVILLSQVNREGYAYAQKHNGSYMMQHVAEASEIERASSYIISVYTDASVQISKLLKLGAIKLRGAQLPLDTINVFADGEFYQVGDVEIPENSENSVSDLFSYQVEKSTEKPNLDNTETSNALDDMIEALF